MASTSPTLSIMEWLADALEGRCVFSRQDLVCDCQEILDVMTISSAEPHERVECRDEILMRLVQWQRDKEFLRSLDLHIIVAKHLRQCSRASGECDLLDVWKDRNVKLDGNALAFELESAIRKTLMVKAPARTEESLKFKSKLRLNHPDCFHKGLEKLIGYPSLHVDPMEAMKAEHEHDRLFIDKQKRHVDPRKEWNIVVGSGQFRIAGTDSVPDFHIKGREIKDDLEHYFKLAETNFRGSNLNRAEVTALRLWTGPMYARYVKIIRSVSDAEESQIHMEMDGEYTSVVGKRGYVNTLHAINSGITKLARNWKVPRDRKLYRGYKDLRMLQLKRDQFGCTGGVESSFLATSESLDVAITYADDGAFILEINIGQVNKGADISWLSQFPHEKEILFNALSNVEFLESPQVCFYPEKGTITVYRVQMSSNLKSRTLDEFGNLRKDLHLNMAESFLTQANRRISDCAETSLHELIKDLCWKLKDRSHVILERGEKAEVNMFNEGSTEYLTLVEEVMFFQEKSLALVELVSNWFRDESANVDSMGQLQPWQLDVLRAAFKENQRPYVAHLTLEEGEKNLDADIFDYERVELGQIHSRNTMMAVAKLLSLNPSLTALDLEADWAMSDVWEDAFKFVHQTESVVWVNGFDVASYGAPSLRMLKFSQAQNESAKMIVLALQYHPPPLLMCLSLSNCILGCTGAESLAHSFTSLRSLTYLEISECKVGDKGCAALARSLTSLQQLTGLNLSHNIIGNQALLLLASISTSLTRLECIDVRFNAINLRLKQLRNLQQFKTNILVEHTFNGQVLGVVWTSDGLKVAAMFRHSILILDANSGKKIRQLSCRNGFTCMVWSPEGSKFATRLSNGSTIIWDAISGEQKLHLPSLDDKWSVDGYWSGGDSIGDGDDIKIYNYNSTVPSVTWSPEGSQIAIRFHDWNLTIWDTETGEQKAVLKGHKDCFISVAWSPEGSRIVTGSDCADGELPQVKIWNAHDGREIADLQGQTGSVTFVAWSADSSMIASRSQDQRVVIWDVVTHTEKIQLTASDLKWLKWSPQGTKIALGCESIITIWDVDTKDSIKLEGHNLPVHSVGWSPEGLKLASGSVDKTIIIWDAKSGEQAGQLQGHSDAVEMLFWSPTGSKILSCGRNSELAIWDATMDWMRGQKGQMKGHTDQAHCVAWGPDGFKFASGSEGGAITIWDIATGEEKIWLGRNRIIEEGPRDWLVDAHPNYEDPAAILSLSWNQLGTKIASVCKGLDYRDVMIVVWDAVNQEKVFEEEIVHESLALKWSRLAWSTDGSKLALGLRRKIVILNATNGQKEFEVGSTSITIYDYGGPESSDSEDWNSESRKVTSRRGPGGYNTVDWNPESSEIVSGSEDSTIIIWNVETGEQRTQLEGHTDSVVSVAWSPEGSKIASASRDGTIIIWDAATGEQKIQLGGHNGEVTSVAWSPDGSKISSGSSDRTVIIWDAETGEQTTQLHGHANFIQSVVWSSEGSTIASGSADCTLILWDVGTGGLKIPPKGHTCIEYSDVFSSGQSRILHGSDSDDSGDESIKFWDAQTAEQKICLKDLTAS